MLLRRVLHILLVLLGLAPGWCASRASAASWRELQAAIQNEDMAAIDVWIQQESSPAAQCDVLVLAAHLGSRTVVERMLGRGVAANCANREGLVPIISAARQGKTEVVRCLLQHGAKAAGASSCLEANCRGHTPLIYAACRRDVEMARLLLEAGADPNEAGHQAIQVAQDLGDTELYVLLERFGGRDPKRQKPISTNAWSRAGALTTLGLTELLPHQLPPSGRTASRSKWRLSIIADETQIAVGDLLTARLSKEAHLDLVERQELDRILAEHHLARRHAVNAANYLQTARLLNADALALIRERELAGQRVMETRLLRVTPGLVLDTIYAPAPLDNPAEWAARLGVRIAGMVSRATRSNAAALALLGIRSSIDSAHGQELERTVNALLNDRLAHHPHFVLLERAALHRVAAENPGPFWTGSYLVDGTVEPALDGTGAFALSVRFQPARAGAGVSETLKFSARGHRDAPRRAIDELLTTLGERLVGQPTPTRGNLDEEAQRYYEEAVWALATRQPAVAQTAAETSWALGLRSPELAKLRITSGLERLRELCPPRPIRTNALNMHTCLELALHGLTTWQETMHGELLRRTTNSAQPWLELGLATVDHAVLACREASRASDQLEQAARLDQVREMCRTVLQEIERRAEKTPDATGLTIQVAERRASLLRFLFPRPADWRPEVRALLARRYPKDDAPIRANLRAKLANFWDAPGLAFPFSASHIQGIQFPVSRADDSYRQLAPMLAASAAAEDRYLGALFELRLAALRGTTSRRELQRLCDSLLGLRDLLAGGGPALRIYLDLFDALDNLEDVPFFALTRHHEGRFMYERHAAEHSRFRGELFVAVAAGMSRPDSRLFQFLNLNRELLPPELAHSVATARARLESLSPGTTRPAATPRLAISRPPPPNPPAAGAAGPATPLRVHRLWHPFDLGLDVPGEFRVETTGMGWRENRIWFHGGSLGQGGQYERHFVFALDPATMRTETFALPEPARAGEARFVVTPSHVIFSISDYLAVLDRPKGQWAVYPEIKPAGLVEPLLAHGHVYLVVREPSGSALIRLDLQRRVTEILASTRRRPAASPFDDPKLAIQSITTDAQGQIVATHGTNRFAWSPERRDWRAWRPGPTPTPASAPPHMTLLSRIGRVGRFGDSPALRLVQQPGQSIDIPLQMIPPAGLRLLPSRYGDHNLAPSFGSAYPGGFLLIPRSPTAAFWVVPQKDLDERGAFVGAAR